MDPTDDPLLTDPDRQKLAAIAAARSPLVRSMLIGAYYDDPDRMARTPRLVMTAHILTLAGNLGGLATTLIDPANDAGLTDVDRDRLRLIEAERDPALLRRFISDYWGDPSRAERTSRVWLYLHLGRMLVLVDHLLERRPDPAALCAAPSLTAPFYQCTRVLGHEGDHVAGLGPWREGDHELARWTGGWGQ